MKINRARNGKTAQAATTDHPPKAHPPEEAVGYLLSHCINRITDAIDASLAELALNAQQFGVLHAIHRGLARTPSGLARLRFTNSASITYTLDRLEDRGLLLRTRSGTDRRLVQLTLTAQGTALTEAAIPKVIDAQARVLAPLSPSDHETLHALLRRIATQDNRSGHTAMPADLQEETP